jgi:hemolysin activation/secretion protein
VIKDYTNREITFAELLQAEAAITQHYIDTGYVNSGALLSADQNLSDGTVTLHIIEGDIEEITVNVDGRLDPDYIRSRIARKVKAPFKVDNLIEALQLLQLNPLVEQISAELAAGTRPERSNLNISVTVADTFDVDLFVDNGRTPSVGSFRRGITITEANSVRLGRSN